MNEEGALAAAAAVPDAESEEEEWADPKEFPNPEYLGASTKEGVASFLFKRAPKTFFRMPFFFCLLSCDLSKLGRALSFALREMKYVNGIIQTQIPKKPAMLIKL